jgi:glutaredoxin 3
MADVYVVYGKQNCPFCDRAKRFLESQGVEYQYLQLDVDYTREELLEMAPNARTVPQIWYYDDDNGQDEIPVHIGGFAELEKHFMNEIEVALNEGAVISVTFTKADGTERVMRCTKNPTIISENYVAPEKKTDRERTNPPGVVAVFDLDKNDWRSFKLETVKDYTILEVTE